MKNKNWPKWIIGLSSVAAFTGFVGLSKQYDEQKQHKKAVQQPIQQNNAINSLPSAVQTRDQVFDEWMSSGQVKQDIIENYTETENEGQGYEEGEDENHEQSEHDYNYKKEKPTGSKVGTTSQRAGENIPSTNPVTAIRSQAS
ncbi:hypothetical protein [Aneurinibacillus terranovensis]|uniref:hypothetical protein n=1 Tax=Aneurinibacillus terranovensis TaxID=278991 RepID=UPI0004226083|nr:hypothetical protein [Aneurinibacillus terranovensis]